MSRRFPCDPGGGGGGTLIFSYIQRLGPLGGGGCQEKEYFWGYENYVDIFEGSSHNWTSFMGYFYVF